MRLKCIAEVGSIKSLGIHPQLVFIFCSKGFVAKNLKIDVKTLKWRKRTFARMRVMRTGTRRPSSV